MKGVRALASGMLVLAATCTVPALSAAQDAATTTDATTTTTTATTPVEPSSPAPPDAPPAESSAGDPRRTPSEPSENGEAASVGVPAAAPAAVASASSAPKARKSASASVSVGDNFYAPTSVTVAVGDTVTWNNNGQAPHSATADDGSFDTGVFDPGGRRSVSFDSAGTFSYYCTVHGQAQSGTVRVLASSGGGGGGGGGGGASSSDDSATSEASAVASPDAAGDANTLPMTGMAVGGLAVVGFALLALGLLARQADPERSRRRWLPIF